MSKIAKATVRLRNFRDAITNPDQYALAKRLKRVVETVILPTIAKGNSPIRGERNFPKYKDKDKYPAQQKPSNKPNLYLSGIMLSFYTAFVVSKRETRIGIDKAAPQDVKDRATGNNLGLNGIPQRMFVPTKGKKFNLTVTNAIKEAISETIKSALRRTKR